MTRLLVLSLLAPGVAGAASPAWFEKGVGAVEIAGRVDVDLYTSTDGRAFAIGRFGEGDETRDVPVRFGLSGENTVPKAVADALEWKVRGPDLAGFVTIPEMRLGDVVLRDVRARIGAHAVLDVGLLDGLAVAVRPSKGVVTLAPAAEADALLAEIGAPVSASVEGAKAWWYHGVKRHGDALSWQIDGQVLGATGVFRVAPHQPGSTLGGEVEGADAIRRGGEPYAWTAARVAGVDLPPTLFRQSQALVGRDGNLLGVLGADALSGVDWAADTASGRFAAAAVTADPRDGTDVLVAIARAEFARAEAEATDKADKADKAEADDEGATQGDAAAVGRHTDLAEALWSAGARGEAFEHYRAAVDAAGERCGPTLTLGRRLLQDGRPDAALLPLQQAAATWDKWYAQAFDVRQDVIADKKVRDGVFDVQQPPTCHEAWGELAAARFAQGSYDEVRAIARTHRELDPLPWQLSGMAGLVQGDPEAANADLRQALQIGARQDAWTIVSLGWASAGLDRPEAVASQLHALAEVPRLDLVAAWSAVELASKTFGTSSVVAGGQALTDDRPESAPAWLALAWAQRGAGADATEALATAVRLAAADRARRPGDDAPIAAWAVATALGGDVEAAQTALGDAIAPSSADYWLAVGLIAQMAGDEEGGASVLSALTRRFPTAPVPVSWAEPAVGDAP